MSGTGHIQFTLPEMHVHHSGPNLWQSEELHVPGKIILPSQAELNVTVVFPKVYAHRHHVYDWMLDPFCAAGGPGQILLYTEPKPFVRNPSGMLAKATKVKGVMLAPNGDEAEIELSYPDTPCVQKGMDEFTVEPVVLSGTVTFL